MRRRLERMRMLITGASSGIGRALALAAGRRGARLVLVARRAERLDDVRQRLIAQNVDVSVVAGDVCDPAVRKSVLDVACDRFSGLDILVNNAGIGAHGHFIDLDPSILRQTMEVNFFALAECCRLAIPILARGNQPLIVNVASMTGRRGVPGWTEYSASKFAVCGFSEALRAELARFDIDLLLVVPGLVDTDFEKNLLAETAKMPMRVGNVMSADEAAASILRGIEHNKSEIWIERNARLMLWVNRFLPRFVDRRLARLVRSLYAGERAERLRSEQ